MRSSSGFNRSTQSPKKYYTSSQVPVSSQFISQKTNIIPTAQIPASQYSRSNYASGLIGGSSYLNPQSGLSSIAQPRPSISAIGGGIPPSAYVNNYMDSRPISYHTGSYSPPRMVQTSHHHGTTTQMSSQHPASQLVQGILSSGYVNNYAEPRPISYPHSSYSPPRIVQSPPTAAVLPNLLPMQGQNIYRQTNPIDGGFYHPNLFEVSGVQKQINPVSQTQKLNITNSFKNGNQEQQNSLNEAQLNRTRVYKKQNIERVFGREVTIEWNYETHKLFSTKELRGFLTNGFQEFEKNLQQLESRFSGLESSFYHLLHKSDTPKDVFDRFLVTLDRRVEKFFESFDETVIQNRGLATDYFDTSVLRNDYEFWNFKTVVKQGIVEVSNKLNDLFILRDNSTFYDAQIIRIMETLIKLYSFLKSDLNTVLNKSILKCGKILEACTYNYEGGEGLKTINFADFIQLDINQLVSQYSEEFERTYPVLLNKKQIVTEKFHDILKDKSSHSQFDLKQLVRSVFSRERRKLYRTIYNSIVKNGKNDLEVNETLQAQNKQVTDKMNKIKNRYLTLKSDPLYMEVMSGRINLEYIKNSPSLFEENSQIVVQLEKFMVNTQQIFEDIKDALNDIIYYKEREQDINKEVFAQILSRAVYDLNQQERIIQDKGDMSELILYQFQILEKSLYSDHSRQNIDSSLENTMMQQLKNNKANYHLHNVAADLVRLEKQKEEQRKSAQENQLKRTKEYSSQIASLMTKPMIDKERVMHPVKEYPGQSIIDDDDRNEDDGSSSIKGLADKLLLTIRQRREDDLEKERNLKEEQEQVRYLKEQSLREEKERQQSDKQRNLENTTKKFNEKREQEQYEVQKRIQQRQQDEKDRRDREQDRQKEDDYKRQNAEDERRRQKEEQDQNRRAREDEDKQKKALEEERKKQKDDDERKRNEDLKKQREEENKKKQQEREDTLKRQKEDDERRRNNQAEEEQRRKKEDEDRKKQKEQEDLKRKQKDEEDRKRQQQIEEDRRIKIEDEDKKRKEEQNKKDEQRRIQLEEDDKKRKQQQEDEKKRQDELKRQKDEDDKIRKQKAEEDDKKRKKDEEDRKKQREEDDKRREDERKKQKEEEDRKKRLDDEKKKQDEDDRIKRQKEDDDRRKKEEEDRKKKDEEDKKRKLIEEEELKKKKIEEEEKKLKKLKEEEEAQKKLKEEQDAKSKKQSGFNYDDIGGSEESGSQYKEDFDIDDYDEILGKDNSKNKKANEPSKNNKGFDQDELYEDIAEDSDNFNDLVGTKFNKPSQITVSNNNVKKTDPPKNVKNNQFDDFEDLDFDDYNDNDLADKKKPVENKNVPSNVVKKGDESKRSNIQNSYDDDYDEDFDDFSDNKKKIESNTFNNNTSSQQNKKSDKKSDNDDYAQEFEDIEEDIDDLMGDTTTNKNDKSANDKSAVVQAKPVVPPLNKPTSLAPLVNDNKKTSNFDYDYDLDFDDDEDGNEDLEKDFKKEVEKQPQKNDAGKKNKDNDFDYQFPEDGGNDFQDEGDDLQDGEQPEGEQMSREQMEQMMRAQQEQEEQNMELSYELIQKTNDYIKKTRFGRSNRVNLSNYDNQDYVIRLYEEYLQNFQIFLFDFPESNKLLELYEAYINESDDIEQQFDDYAAEIQKIYYTNTQLTDFHPQTKLYFPLESNSIGFQLIEVNLNSQAISYFYMVDESEETLVQSLNEFHKFFCQVLGLNEQFQASPSKVEDNTLKVLQIYEKEPHLQYMIMLFPLIYEFMSDMSDINVDQNTIDRIFYIQLSLEHFYTELETNQNAVSDKFSAMIDSYQSHKEFFIAIQEYEEFSPEAFEQLLQDMNQIKNDVLQSDEKKYALVMFSINAGQMQFSFYFYVSKSLDDSIPHEIGLFCLSMSDQINNQIIDSFESLQEDNVAFRPHVDTSRHNGLYEYSEFTIATWAHLIEKKNLSPFVAINIINFSMIPYYVTYKGLD